MQEQYNNWQHSSHHTVAVCADCHMPQSFFAKYYTKAENGFLHSKAFTLQNYHEPIEMRQKSSKILNNACIGCHSDLVDAISGQSSSAHGFIADWANRSNKPEDINSCTRCHSNVGH